MDDNVTNYCNGNLTRKEEDVLIIIRGSIGVVGICTCIISISLVFCLKLHKHFMYRMAMYKVVSTMLVNVLHIVFMRNIHHTLDDVICQITGFIFTYFLWINLLFTIIIMLHFFSLAVCLKNLKHLEVYYIVVTLVFPLAIAWIPFTTNSYGPTYDGMCWINTLNIDCTTNKVGQIERFVIWYGPSYFILVISIFAAVLIITVLLYKGCCHSKENEREPLLVQQDSQHKKAVMELFPLLMYPAIYFIYNVFDIIFHSVEKFPYKTALIYTIIISTWTMLSSITLLILIAITKYNKKKYLSKRLIQYNQSVNEVAIFTADNNTGNDAVFIPPRESEIDHLFEE